MCHQTVSLVARHLEASGIPTVVVGCARDIVEECGVPVALMDRPWNRDLSGVRPATAACLVRCGDWSEIAARFPVTWGEYLHFLDALAERDGVEAAEVWWPRERAGMDGGNALVGWIDGRHQFVPDADLLGIYWYAANGADGTQLDQRTVFEVASLHPGEPPLFLRNLRSTVIVGDASNGHTFRNPPHFMPLLGHQRLVNAYWEGLFASTGLYNAEAETKALLDHLFEHPNTAPFIAHRFIQKLVDRTPNPNLFLSFADFNPFFF